MIPISSNGWISNSVSYARIASVVRGAQDSAQSGGVNPACKMGRCEKFVDYVFCGSVKKQYLKYLHKMTLAKMRTLDSTDEQSAATSKDRDYIRLGKIWDVEYYEEELSQLMSGNSLKFCLTASGHPAYWENYLIYRDKRRLVSLGIFAHLPAPDVSVAQNPQMTLVPSFNAAQEIRAANLADIRRSGKLICGNQTHVVRFTKMNEPIVMQDQHSPQVDLIQQKLLNLWSVNKVRERLVRFRSVPLTNSALHCYWYRDEKVRFADWIRFINVIKQKFNTAVSVAQARLHAQSRVIDAELDRFERLTVPDWNDKRAFLKLQEKIGLLKRSRNAVNKNIYYFQQRLCEICRGYFTIDDYLSENEEIESEYSNRLYFKFPEFSEFFKVRLLKFFEQMTRFFMLEMNEADTAKFRMHCRVQMGVLGRFLPERLKELLDPPALKSWRATNMHPPEFRTQQEILLSLLKDPAIGWKQIDATMKRMKIEQDNLIELKYRQFDMMSELYRRMNATVWNAQGQGVVVRHGRFSPEYITRIDLIEEIWNRLAVPGTNFTQAELDDFGNRINQYLTLTGQECSTRGFVPRVMPPLPGNAAPGAVRLTANASM